MWIADIIVKTAISGLHKITFIYKLLWLLFLYIEIDILGFYYSTLL